MHPRVPADGPSVRLNSGESVNPHPPSSPWAASYHSRQHDLTKSEETSSRRAGGIAGTGSPAPGPVGGSGTLSAGGRTQRGLLSRIPPSRARCRDATSPPSPRPATTPPPPPPHPQPRPPSPH